MKNYRVLLNVIRKNSELVVNENGKKNKSYEIAGSLAMLAIMLPCCFIVGLVVNVMTQALMESGGMTEGLELVILLLSVFGVIFSVMVIFNVLYFSSDIEQLLPLPVKPFEIVAAKFTYSYLAESVMEFVILISGFIGFFIAGPKNVVSIITAVFGVFLLPVLPLVYCGIFALIAMAFFSKVKAFRNVDLMVGIATILFGGLFVYSFIRMDSININNYIESLMDGSNIFMNIMDKIFFTVPFFLKALGEGDALAGIIFVGINALFIAVMLFLGDKLYLKGVYMAGSAGRSGRKSVAKDRYDYRARKPFAAYVKKECKILFRTPAYRKYCVVVNIIWPLLAVGIFVIPSTRNFMVSMTKLLHAGYVASDIIMLLTVIGVAFFATAMNSIASTAFTREGGHLAFVKYIPFDYREQIKIKYFVSMLYSGITVAISVIIFSVMMNGGVVRTIYLLVIGLMCTAICTYIGVMLDAAHPKLKWEDEYGALRGSASVFFNMAIAILIAGVLCGFGFVLFKFTRFYSDTIYAAFFVVLLISCIVIRRVSMARAVDSIVNDIDA